MSWIYSQSTGKLTLNGRDVATGYSGHGLGRNNANMAAMAGIGPTPQGTYKVGNPHSSNHMGSYTMNLDPLPGTNTFGRTLFRVHGDNKKRPGQASDGCIVLPLVAQSIWIGGDHLIQVTP